MKNIQILDCTLRDGGRIINCQFENTVIRGMIQNLTDANIDIIEMGFLRSKELTHYEQNSTFFTEVKQMKPFLSKKRKNTVYVAFADFGMYDFACLEKCDGETITGIRVGFTKDQFINQRDKIRNDFFRVKEQGYRLYVQGVNTLAYTDRELLELIDIINEIKPYSFGIVDTYGAMYLEDITHYYSLVDYNLSKEICIDIHTHNNFQLSFAFAQQIISLASGKRKIILDATLNGMGKCAGNLNTELIVDFLVRKKDYDYDIDEILDVIDRYLYPIKKKYHWGYSIPAFMAGIYKAHPNNIIYLTEKYRLNSKDIKYIISGIDERTRQRYDYDKIQTVYKKYCTYIVDDSCVIKDLAAIFTNRHVLILVPGKSIITYQDKIENCISNRKPIVICVNFYPKNTYYDYLFYANTIHWEKISRRVERKKSIVTSNIHVDTEGTYLVDYTSLIMEESFLYDNSTIMLLNLLKKLQVSKITLAGFDGFKTDEENYIDNTFPDMGDRNIIKKKNDEVKSLVNQYMNRVRGKISVSFLTPSIYDKEERAE